MRRYNVNQDWELPKDITWDKVPIAVLMDIRDELKTLNQLFHCSNFVAIPTILRAIRRNTTKRRHKKT